MKKRLQGLLTGLLIGATLTNGGVCAKNIRETIDAVYMNVKLVVDGEEITPKDVNGNVVEPFIYNGTTYLPVRAIAEAFDKDVYWDGDTATVYVGDIVKPAKEVYLYDKPYLECEKSFEFVAKKLGSNWYDEDVSNYIGFDLGEYEYIDKDTYQFSNSVTYALNGLATKIKGTFKAPQFNQAMHFAEYQVKFYNESGKLLYKSPIINPSTADIDFEFECGKCISLKVEFSAVADDDQSMGILYCMIEDFSILTTDY